MFEIPTYIEIGDKQLNITDKGDFRMVLDCFSALNDMELKKEQRVLCALTIFYEDFKDENDVMQFSDLTTAVTEMYRFFNCGDSKGVGCKRPHNLIDWEGDAQLVASAINKVANTEIRALDYLHWWTFMGYYLAIGNSPLANIVGIRYKIARQEKLEKYERKFRDENPQYFKNINNHIDKEYDDFIKQVWNRGN